MLGEPPGKHPLVEKGHKGQVRAAMGSRRLPGRRRQRPGGDEGVGEARGARAGGAHLELGVLEHVAHAALVLLEAEEDVPQPQGGHEHHEGVKRHVPQVDGVQEHGAGARAANAGHPARTARAPDARTLRRSPAEPAPRAPARRPRRPRRPQCACALRPTPPGAARSGGGDCSGSANLSAEATAGARRGRVGWAGGRGGRGAGRGEGKEPGAGKGRERQAGGGPGEGGRG